MEAINHFNQDMMKLEGNMRQLTGMLEDIRHIEESGMAQYHQMEKEAGHLMHSQNIIQG